MILARPVLGRIVTVLVCFSWFSWFVWYIHPSSPSFAPGSSEAVVEISLQQQQQQQQQQQKQQPKAPEIEIVVASLKSDNTTWFHKHLPPQWQKSIYVVDDRRAQLTVPQNKGHEAMVYLTHIVTNYDNLAENLVFFHASRFAWHNDDPDYDGLPTLRNFRFSYLREMGYVNLRCVWIIGCPEEIRPMLDANEDANELASRETPSAKGVYKDAFQQLFPGQPVPELVAVSCCSQFAVTRETIRRRPREDYVRFLEWLEDTPLKDEFSGRVFEFAWHIIFGKEAVHCPSVENCYCKLWGLCDLNCTQGACEGRYTLPRIATLPGGWPEVGWSGEKRPFSGPLD